MQELLRRAEGAGLRELAVLAHVLAVDQVGPLHPSVDVRRLRRLGHLADEGIALLATEKLPRGIAAVIGRPAILPVVVVVGGQVGVHAGPAEHLRDRVVERLQRPPRRVQEVGPPGVEVAPRRHARHGADVGALEGRRPPRQPREVGGVGPVAAVGRQQVPVERVEHDHDRFHGKRE